MLSIIGTILFVGGLISLTALSYGYPSSLGGMKISMLSIFVGFILMVI